MDMEALVMRQRRYFEAGQTRETAARIRALERLYREISQREAGIAEALKADLNKSPLESQMTEISLIKEEIRYGIKHLSAWTKHRRVKSPLSLFPAKSYVIPEPYGVVLILAPWNYPFLLALGPLIGALAAGNCAVVKPSRQAPKTAKIVAELISGCFPEEYCTVLLDENLRHEALLAVQFDYIFFTGGMAAGKAVMAAAAKWPTPVTLELGGKSPVLIDETADLSLTAKRLVFGKYINAGQTCVAPDYVLVQETRRDALLSLLKKWIEICYPMDQEAGTIKDYPKIINEVHYDRLTGLLQGETVAVGGVCHKEIRTITPTVLTEVHPDSPVMQEEIFGPILPVLTYRDFNEAISFVRQRPKPLALYLFSKNKAVVQRVQQELSYGGGCINDTLVHLSTPYLPFGGVGESGMGAYHGKAGFDTFTHYKSIVKKGTRLDIAFRYRPYTEHSEQMLRKVLK